MCTSTANPSSASHAGSAAWPSSSQWCCSSPLFEHRRSAHRRRRRRLLYALGGVVYVHLLLGHGTGVTVFQQRADGPPVLLIPLLERSRRSPGPDAGTASARKGVDPGCPCG
ncbi:MAG: hypothetical protein R2705_01015 [Ilumatobacteraceae bacterium]